MKDKKIPWREMFLYIVQVYKISPKDFWDMTMKEFIYLTGSPESSEASITKNDLEHMIKNFNQEVK
jgi:hypothetical protein